MMCLSRFIAGVGSLFYVCARRVWCPGSLRGLRSEVVMLEERVVAGVTLFSPFGENRHW
jgi:hypothetical protein